MFLATTSMLERPGTLFDADQHCFSASPHCYRFLDLCRRAIAAPVLWRGRPARPLRHATRGDPVTVIRT
jgi:hypothetical protein